MKLIITYLLLIFPLVGYSQTVSLQSNGAGGSKASGSGISYVYSVGGTVNLFALDKKSETLKETNSAAEQPNAENLLELSELRAFPNPCTDVLSIYFPSKLGPVDFESVVAEVSGRILPVKSQVNSNSISFSFTDLAPGMYTITIFSKKNNFIKAFKVIKAYN